MSKIKLNLFDLKSKENLSLVYGFFNNFLSKYFDESGKPLREFFESVNCPICGSAKSELAYNVDKFDYFKCSKCNSIYTSPFLKPSVLDEIYSSGAYDEYQKKLVHSSQSLRKGILDKRKVDQIEALIPKKGVLLDIGCGQGTFLKSCLDRGWEVEGLDPSASSAKLAKEKFGINVNVSNIESFNATRQYDCVTMWGVLEHLSRPQEVLKKVSSLCRKGGILQFEVPSSDCLISKYLEKENFSPMRFVESGRHNIFFSLKAIKLMAKNCGFEIAEIESNGLDVQTILMEEFDSSLTNKILIIQDILNDVLLGDHYRVFLRKL